MAQEATTPRISWRSQDHSSYSVITNVQFLAISAYFIRTCRKMIKHVRTGLQTRPDVQSYNRSGGTALESRPHMFHRGAAPSFGCGRRPPCDYPWHFTHFRSLEFSLSINRR